MYTPRFRAITDADSVPLWGVFSLSAWLSLAISADLLSSATPQHFGFVCVLHSTIAVSALDVGAAGHCTLTDLNVTSELLLTVQGRSVSFLPIVIENSDVALAFPVEHGHRPLFTELCLGLPFSSSSNCTFSLLPPFLFPYIIFKVFLVLRFPFVNFMSTAAPFLSF